MPLPSGSSLSALAGNFGLWATAGLLPELDLLSSPSLWIPVIPLRKISSGSRIPPILCVRYKPVTFIVDELVVPVVDYSECDTWPRNKA